MIGVHISHSCKNFFCKTNSKLYFLFQNERKSSRMHAIFQVNINVNHSWQIYVWIMHSLSIKTRYISTCLKKDITNDQLVKRQESYLTHPWHLKLLICKQSFPCSRNELLCWTILARNQGWERLGMRLYLWCRYPIQWPNSKQFFVKKILILVNTQFSIFVEIRSPKYWFCSRLFRFEDL